MKRKKRNVRIEQLGLDVVIPKGITTEEAIEKIETEINKLGIEVIGFMPTDTSWSWNEYFNLE